MEAWLAVGKDRSVVSHQSALDLLNVGDIIPDCIHISVPRSIRNLPRLAGVAIHTTHRPIEASETMIRDGICTTSATRAILDSAELGVPPDQIEAAIRDALDQGLATRGQLRHAAGTRSRRLQEMIAHAIPPSP
jgi:predicted transcriptional regulator of viral defense system